MRILVTRPADLARTTAARIESLGHEPLIAPLLTPRPLAWAPPPGEFDALLFTSPQGPALAGPQLAPYRGLPAYAVGARTAAAARAAGFADVRLDAPIGRLLHLCGREVTASDLPATRVPVYAAELLPLDVATAGALRQGGIDRVLLFSARTAAHFAAEVGRLGLDRGAIALAAISPAALAAAGGGWRAASAAATPDEAGVLAAAGLLCDKHRD